LNPEIDDDCTNLLLGEAHCVAPVSDISTYSNHPVTTPLFTVPLATFSSVDTQIPTSTSGSERTYTPTAMPLAEGTLEDCEQYQDYDPDYPEFNRCTRVARSMDVTTDQLLRWNLSLSSNMSTCALQPGYRYCSLKDKDSRKCPGRPSLRPIAPKSFVSPNGSQKFRTMPQARRGTDACQSTQRSPQPCQTATASPPHTDIWKAVSLFRLSADLGRKWNTNVQLNSERSPLPLDRELL
jgi:hypothetical protein